IALISNFIYKELLTRDFENYINERQKERVFCLKTSLEGCYKKGAWDNDMLFETIHWGIMLGFDMQVTDTSGHRLLGVDDVLSNLDPKMLNSMKKVVEIDKPEGDYDKYPILVNGKEFGFMAIRPFRNYGFRKARAWVFRKRGQEFIIISIAIAGGGSLALAFLFSRLLTNPLRNLREAASKIANRDFDVILPIHGDEEIASLSGSFNYMAEALRREDSLRKNMMTDIAHELRNPLTIMKVNIEAMIDKVISDPSIGLENLHIETEKLINLVKGIEDLTKVEAGFFKKCNYSNVLLIDYFMSIFDEFRLIAEQKGLELRINGEKDAVAAVDIEKLSIITGNLLSNAIKYTVSGSILLDYMVNEDYFIFSVSDTGIGIGEGEKEMVFRRFYRGKTSGGMGIGLAIVKEMVNIMGGEITVQSVIGNGSIFRVSLPLKNDGADT
ncbi:MAG: HAMP domain-containing histidine kinase, partial [Nitrospirae bacterium]|nr:HAMP domain-containing histidine kinase [Nitrospirota bacterium]